MTDPVDCDFDPKSASLTDAQADILAAVKPVADEEVVALESALGRILLRAITADINVPPHANSAMDGYALRLADLQAADNKQLPVAGTNLAGLPSFTMLPLGACVRIMTGAVLPEGADAVVMQEQTDVGGELVRFNESVRPQQNIRNAGEDIACGDEVVPEGCLLMPAQLGVLASQGVTTVSVRRRLRVGVFVTGDELQGPGQPLAAGQIYDSNRLTVLNMLRRLGIEAIDLGRVADCRESLDTLLSNLPPIDVLVTTGGVSVGEADFVRDAVAAVGSLQLWRVAIKPGRPFAYGQLPATNGGSLPLHFFGLPGNPVSAMITFYLLVRPALLLLQGRGLSAATDLPLWPATTTGPIKKRPGRMDFQRARFEHSSGEISVTVIADQGSGRLSSMTAANCLVVLPAGAAAVEAGANVSVLPFSEIF